ncbi:hypothetical protein BDU57DRAFT_517566 [Ampelomyces quisqualis]|uniref:Uncharacterized protein n=1 Tax=Ampelomyces quisqualis TaxID=50730 RepID=A0A6A5QQF3_AMPQU|nr:hypothetical protein BDU57DRAFT_517566 [Ampelomyces quisqualis]
MENQHSSPSWRPEGPRLSTQGQRSNSLPIVEALGCSTPEAQLILAEGRAAVLRRRARKRGTRSFNDELITTFRPQNHLKYLVAQAWNTEAPSPLDARFSQTRIPSHITNRSTSAIVPQARDTPTSPLGNYSAHLAQFIKSQLQSIPTYQPEHDLVATLLPWSCPEFSFPTRSSSPSPKPLVQRPTEVPRAITIPPVRPPMRSAFSAWSSADDDDEVEDDAHPLPDIVRYTSSVLSQASNDSPSVLGYYEAINSASFLLSSTPMEDDEEPATAKDSHFPNHPVLTDPPESHDDNDYPSSCMSRPQLTSSSAPSISSSLETSYFDHKLPFSIAPQLKDRIIAALTPPAHAKMFKASSPWEVGAISNVYDVFVESQQRVRVDGMSFDMLREFTFPNRVTTPC